MIFAYPLHLQIVDEISIVMAFDHVACDDYRA